MAALGQHGGKQGEEHEHAMPVIEWGDPLNAVNRASSQSGLFLSLVDTAAGAATQPSTGA
ncbi:MAG: hypothetical protein OHK0015_15060 [Chloroflexi bacterium OHK40]